MTREECEGKILEKLLEIKTLYDAYNPNANYLGMCIFKDYLSANNELDKNDKQYPLETHVFLEGVK